MRKKHYAFKHREKQPDIKTYSLLFCAIFALAFSVSAIYVRTADAELPLRTVEEHFSPLEDGKSMASVILGAFYEDALNLVYIFAFGFTFFGKPANAALILLRGIAFGHSFGSMTVLLTHDYMPFTLAEFIIYPLFTLTVNALLIVFSAESTLFNAGFRQLPKVRMNLLKTPAIKRYITDFVCISGLVVVLKTIYTCIIILI